MYKNKELEQKPQILKYLDSVKGRQVVNTSKSFGLCTIGESSAFKDELISIEENTGIFLLLWL